MEKKVKVNKEDYPHPGNWAIVEYMKNKRLSNEVVFVENSTYARHHIKKRIIDEKMIPYECSICGQGPEWRGKPMPLILDHKNGIRNDNRLKNLRFVCSNCECQLPTYKARNIGNYGGGPDGRGAALEKQ